MNQANGHDDGFKEAMEKCVQQDAVEIVKEVNCDSLAKRGREVNCADDVDS